MRRNDIGNVRERERDEQQGWESVVLEKQKSLQPIFNLLNLS